MKLSPKAKTVPLKAMSDLKHLFETNVASGTFQLSTHNSSAILPWSPIVRGLMFDAELMRKASLGGGQLCDRHPKQDDSKCQIQRGGKDTCEKGTVW